MYYYKALKVDPKNGDYPIGTLFVSDEEQDTNFYKVLTKEEKEYEMITLRRMAKVI